MKPAAGASAFIRGHKTIFVAILVGVFLLEPEIFTLAVTESGKTTLRISDVQGRIIYEADERYPGAFDQE